MTFGLPSWLKSVYGDIGYEVPVWYPKADAADRREWIVPNGLGGFSSGTISGINTRRYHAILVSALNPPAERFVILSKLSEQVTIGNTQYELDTSEWASGVMSPAGYRFIESFTMYPVPTWVFNLDGHYLIKQLILPPQSNCVYISYHWMPEDAANIPNATITVRFLTGFRHFHRGTKGSANKLYTQKVLPSHTIIDLDNSGHELCVSWNHGTWEKGNHWWWELHWSEESARGLHDQEDLFLLGHLSTKLDPQKPLHICASLDDLVTDTDGKEAFNQRLKQQRLLLVQANLPRTLETNLLVWSSSNFIVAKDTPIGPGKSIIAGYPWFNDFGRDVLISLPGLCLATHRFAEAKLILQSIASFQKKGLFPMRFFDRIPNPDYQAADVSLWWAWALWHYYQATQDKDFIQTQLPMFSTIYDSYNHGTTFGIEVDPQDGLVRCGAKNIELSWMDTRVAEIPITPRSGKPVEIAALWFNFLCVFRYFCKELNQDSGSVVTTIALVEKSMQKYWNSELNCLYDVLEAGNKPPLQPDDSIRPNQIFAVSLPFRALTPVQEKAILNKVGQELLTEFGLRTLSPHNASYQPKYGCGFLRADQYHRDISYHQGTAWPWLLGAYCDALINVNGPIAETYEHIKSLFQPLLQHLVNEAGLGEISEIFDGSSPQNPHGAFAKAWCTAEVLRSLAPILQS